MSKRTWSELSDTRRRLVAVAAVLQVALQVAALCDLRRRPREQVNGPRWAWVAATFVNFVGPVAYFVIGRRHPALRT